MDNKYIEQLRTYVKDALRTDNMRYQHTLGVANTSACLAMCHGADMNKAYIAGLLHDCAKCVPDDVKIADFQYQILSLKVLICFIPSLVHIMQHTSTMLKIKKYALQSSGIQQESLQ